MFNNSMKGVSALSFALMASVKDLLKTNTFEEIQKDGISFFNDKGDIYLPLATRNFETPLFDPPGRAQPNFIDFREFRSMYLSKDITTITYDESISLPALLTKLAEEPSIYGVILEEKSKKSHSREDKFLFNPLHPLNTFLIASGIIDIPKEGKLHIFEWSGTSKSLLENETKVNRFFEHYQKEYAKLFELAPHIIKEPIKRKRIASISNGDISSLIDFPFIEMINTDIMIEENTHAGRGNNIKSFFIPTQLAIDSIATPYYGLIYMEKRSGSPKGISLTPMYSGNINAFNGEERDYSENRARASSGNVCTGSYNNDSRKGWFTLSKVNLGSMFYPDIVDEKSAVYFAEASKQISGEIWKALRGEDVESSSSEPEVETETQAE